MVRADLFVILILYCKSNSNEKRARIKTRIRYWALLIIVLGLKPGEDVAPDVLSVVIH